MDDQLIKFIELVSNLSTAAMMFIVLFYVIRNSGRQSSEDNKLLQGMMKLYASNAEAIQLMSQTLAAIQQSIAEQQQATEAARANMRMRVDALDSTMGTLPDALARQEAQLEAIAIAQQKHYQSATDRDLSMLNMLNKALEAVDNMQQASRALADIRPVLAAQISNEHARLETLIYGWLTDMLKERVAPATEGTAD